MVSNNEMIQKLTLGKEDTTIVKVEWNGEETEWLMRPLTSGELSRLQVIEKRAFHIKVGMKNGRRETVTTNMEDIDINTAEFTQAQNEAMYEAVANSLSCNGETVKADLIKTMPAGLPEVLFGEVIEVSKLADTDLTMIKQFRKNQ